VSTTGRTPAIVAATARARQRGAVSVMFAILVSFVLVALVAFVVDLGHLWEVKSELQNAADSAALGGVRMLTGKSTGYANATTWATNYGKLNNANGYAVNVPAADVALGTWDFGSKAFTAKTGSTPADIVSAVQVTTRRDASTSTAVSMFFAQAIGVSHKDVRTLAVAVAGGPSTTCGFPIAVADCVIFDPSGAVNCGAAITLTFAPSTSNNAGLADLTSTANPTPPLVDCEVQNAFGTCGKGCTCASSSCVTSSTSQQVALQNGNDISNNSVTYIQNAVAAAGVAGLYVMVPVINTSATGNCLKYTYNGTETVAGYASLKLTGATGPPNRSVTATIDCTHTNTTDPGGGGFFGTPTTKIYLVQ
jgi:Flp pilus assembly protein TadG